MDLSLLSDVTTGVVNAAQHAPTLQGGDEATRFNRLAAGVAIGVGAIGPGIGIGLAVQGAMGAIGRNPEAVGDVRTTMIIGAALSEAVAIYAFLIALLILFT